MQLSRDAAIAEDTAVSNRVVTVQAVQQPDRRGVRSSAQMSVILIPGTGGRADWPITAPWLKLSLKYGIVGPWKAPNWSVAFDGHSAARGPARSSVSIADFAVTSLMNSNVAPA